MLNVAEIRQLAADAAAGNRKQLAAFRVLAIFAGLYGKSGGWIYLPGATKPIGHGWQAAAQVAADALTPRVYALLVEMSKASCSPDDIAMAHADALIEDVPCDCDGEHAPTEGGHSVACRRREALGAVGYLFAEPTVDEQHAEALLTNEAHGAWQVTYDGEGGTIPACRDDRGMHLGPGHVAPATIAKAYDEALVEDVERDAAAGRPVRVVFERVGRTRGVSLLVDRELLGDPSGFAYAVHKGVRGRIASKSFEVDVDVERGVVLLEGGRFGRGSFPVPPADPLGEQVPVTVTAFEIVDGAKVPIGAPRERAISRGALELMHGTDPRADRLEHAFAEFTKLADSGGPGTARGLVAAVESATTISARQLAEAVSSCGPEASLVRLLAALGFKIN